MFVYFDKKTGIKNVSEIYITELKNGVNDLKIDTGNGKLKALRVTKNAIYSTIAYCDSYDFRNDHLIGVLNVINHNNGVIACPFKITEQFLNSINAYQFAVEKLQDIKKYIMLD